MKFYNFILNPPYFKIRWVINVIKEMFYLVQFWNGKEVSEKILNELKEKITKENIQPGLAVILVGDNPASQIYVKNKEKACNDVGFKSLIVRLPEDVPEDVLLYQIHQLNTDNNIHGILVQLPLPEHINVQNVINAIDTDKDVDCFKAENLGKLVLGNNVIAPCTPSGVMEIFDHYGYLVDGKDCVIIGRSNIVGKPMQSMMLHRNATVMNCHTHTKNLKDKIRNADIIICAAGQKDLITPDMLSKDRHYAIIDIGINRGEDKKIFGDVSRDVYELNNVSITPVPGGIGPMTISILMKNTYLLAKNSLKNN